MKAANSSTKKKQIRMRKNIGGSKSGSRNQKGPITVVSNWEEKQLNLGHVPPLIVMQRWPTTGSVVQLAAELE